MKDQTLLMTMAAMSSTPEQIIDKLANQAEQCKQHILINGNIDISLKGCPDCFKELVITSTILHTKLAMHSMDSNNEINSMLKFLKLTDLHGSILDKIKDDSN